MATVLPPPSKRQRTAAAERAGKQQEPEAIPENLGSIRVHFTDSITGNAVGNGPVLIPVADANVKNLELLVNSILGHVCAWTMIL